ncbi:MAG: pilus assembly protein PilP [Pseudohongiellaceae bacterium]
MVISNRAYGTTGRSLAAFLVLLLTACNGGSETAQLRQQLSSIAEQPGGEIEPLPEFESYEAFTYSAASLRSPFELPRIASQDDGEPPAMVQPDLEREREPLEAFSINSLEMVGMLRREDRTMALVRDETGQVHRVTRGNYMGRNHGQVNSITAERIELTEIVPAGDGGWIERPRTVELSQ